jgi:hypothetical protein
VGFFGFRTKVALDIKVDELCRTDSDSDAGEFFKKKNMNRRKKNFFSQLKKKKKGHSSYFGGKRFYRNCKNWIG